MKDVNFYVMAFMLFMMVGSMIKGCAYDCYSGVDDANNKGGSMMSIDNIRAVIIRAAIAGCGTACFVLAIYISYIVYGFILTTIVVTFLESLKIRKKLSPLSYL